MSERHGTRRVGVSLWAILAGSVVAASVLAYIGWRLIRMPLERPVADEVVQEPEKPPEPLADEVVPKPDKAPEVVNAPQLKPVRVVAGEPMEAPVEEPREWPSPSEHQDFLVSLERVESKRSDNYPGYREVKLQYVFEDRSEKEHHVGLYGEGITRLETDTGQGFPVEPRSRRLITFSSKSRKARRVSLLARVPADAREITTLEGSVTFFRATGRERLIWEDPAGSIGQSQAAAGYVFTLDDYRHEKSKAYVDILMALPDVFPDEPMYWRSDLLEFGVRKENGTLVKGGGRGRADAAQLHVSRRPAQGRRLRDLLRHGPGTFRTHLHAKEHPAPSHWGRSESRAGRSARPPRGDRLFVGGVHVHAGPDRVETDSAEGETARVPPDSHAGGLPGRPSADLHLLEDNGDRSDRRQGRVA